MSAWASSVSSSIAKEVCKVSAWEFKVCGAATGRSKVWRNSLISRYKWSKISCVSLVNCMLAFRMGFNRRASVTKLVQRGYVST
ncbi:Uncharacterised protein [Vibrio cholerae]|nr:Uncharacterised protein [Vibrio cholerae]CSI67690.1 Uncharacterised protein [Vibrio cholerae]